MMDKDRSMLENEEKCRQLENRLNEWISKFKDTEKNIVMRNQERERLIAEISLLNDSISRVKV